MVRESGLALLVSGYDLSGERRQRDRHTLETLGGLGELLLACAADWQIRRVSPADRSERRPERARLKGQMDEFSRSAVELGLLAISGGLTVRHGQPALIAGSLWRDYPEDELLPLSWVRARLQGGRIERVLVLMQVDVPEDEVFTAEQLLAELSTEHPHYMIVAHTRHDHSRLLQVALHGLRGEGLQPESGVVTLASLGRYVRGALPDAAIQWPRDDQEFLAPPPLMGLWDIRWSAPMHRSRQPESGAAADGTVSDLVGQVLPGRFRVLRELAHGNFGVIYLGHQIPLQRDVAIKVLRAPADPESDDWSLFLREIQTVARLDHPNVVRIHQADLTTDGRLFYAMELLAGRSLESHLREVERVPVELALGLVKDILAGLAAAHDAGIIHSDVKPANIMLVPDDGDGDAESPAGNGRPRAVLLDFGLARLAAIGETDAVGGTMAYMAPEQLRQGRVDARSDLFAVGLVLCEMLTGWRRTSIDTLYPSLADDVYAGHGLRATLRRALASDPEARFPDARSFSDALAGRESAQSERPQRPPFRKLASFTERDSAAFFGREPDITELLRSVLFAHVVLYTAPSGVGKTSLLRAGLLPRLGALDLLPEYLSCRLGVARVHAQIRVLASRDRERGVAPDRRVLVLDHVEALFIEQAGDNELRERLLRELVAARTSLDERGRVVLCVREDFLGRVIASAPLSDEPVPIHRLGPLGRAGAREAIVQPLAEHRLSIEPELLERLLDDLQAAAVDNAAQFGWEDEDVVYPPHLQLVCTVLYESMPGARTELTLRDYLAAGGLQTIIGEHLERVLDTELDESQAAIARLVFLALVSEVDTCRRRPQNELVHAVGGRYPAEMTVRVLEILRARGLLLPVPLDRDEPGWELAHDGLVARVLSWTERRDLGRRRAKEIVRYHLHRSNPDQPSLLDGSELRELLRYPQVVAELAAEIGTDDAAPERGAWTPARLVARSRSRLRWRRAGIALGVLAVLLAASLGGRAWLHERDLRARDIGRITVSLMPYDWDAQARVAIPVAPAELDLRFTMYPPDEVDERRPASRPLSEALFSRTGRPEVANGALDTPVEVRGGKAYVRIDGRGRRGSDCPPSWIRVIGLPGYVDRERRQRVALRVPTCQASRTTMVEIPAGEVILSRPGESPPAGVRSVSPPRFLPDYRIDRTEVSNAEYAVYASMEAYTGIGMPAYIDTPEVKDGGEPDRPVARVSWFEAREYCWFMGKTLPDSAHWEKAAGGGLTLDRAEQRDNPYPARNTPWEPGRFSTAPAILPANFDDQMDGFLGAAPVDEIRFLNGQSPYGLLHVAGNVQEWTTEVREGSFRIARGGSWSQLVALNHHTITWRNPREPTDRYYDLGMRCVESPWLTPGSH